MNVSPIKAETAANPILLVIDPDHQAIASVLQYLAPIGIHIHSAQTAQAGLSKFHALRPPLVLIDSHVDEAGGLATLQEILLEDPRAQVIVTSSEYSTDAAVDAIRGGAVDFLLKPFNGLDFSKRITKWLSRTHQIPLADPAEGAPPQQWMSLIGASDAMKLLFSRIQRFAPHFRTVLIQGETGTGKELVARAFHGAGPQKSKPMVVCNCAAFSESLLESELFGHVKGAFTGAVQDQPGLVVSADGGTLFLDEIGELPLHAQAKLLRVLQTGEVRPVGSAKPRIVDLRVVAATNRDLRRMVAEKTFREDLYYRIAMLELRLPPLRERKGDIPLLVRHFLRHFGEQFQKPGVRLTPRALRMLEEYSWPGNVRQLENSIGAAILSADGDIVDRHDFPPEFENGLPSKEDPDAILTLDEVALRHVRYVLDKVDGNRRRAADLLGISRATLYRLLKEPLEEAS